MTAELTVHYRPQQTSSLSRYIPSVSLVMDRKGGVQCLREFVEEVALSGGARAREAFR